MRGSEGAIPVTSIIDFLLTPIGDAVTGLQLIFIGCIGLTWGTLAIVDVHVDRRKELEASRGNILLYVRALFRFEWFLGWFLFTWVGVLGFVLAFLVLHSSGGVAIWAALLINVCFLFAAPAYVFWAQAKINGGLQT
jgi:hypothetical protein